MGTRPQNANKQFKSDSARLAFLVWVKFSVYGVQIEYGGSVLHTLIGRYATQGNLGVQSFGISLAIRFVLSANEHFYPKFRGLLKP
ncbi:hypothetical protein CCZ37_17075 [Vibrio qinghaiensis]|uniref:DUF3265 domain-containing protein n=1 Tax=Vibrio qinghaiensis TaxID=2025808 RepID=A0A223N463_9VIBR|nr:hypothetical protein CCZ37_17075 [Vibrio qinghaiensis]